MNKKDPPLRYCKRCHSPIRFVKTKQGKFMPVEALRRYGSELKGKTFVSIDGITYSDPPDDIEGYEPHWAHCSHSNHFRKKA